MKNKEKILSIRIDYDLYEKIVHIALKQSNEQKKIIKISEVIRNTLIYSFS